MLHTIHDYLLNHGPTTFCLIAPTNGLSDTHDDLTQSTLHQLSASTWNILCTTLNMPYFGDTVDSP